MALARFLRPISRHGRKVYEVDPMVCPRCGATMKVISFLTDYGVVNRLALAHSKLNLTSDNAPIYHSPRWGEVKLVLKISFNQRSRKGVSSLLLAYN